MRLTCCAVTVAIGLAACGSAATGSPSPADIAASPPRELGTSLARIDGESMLPTLPDGAVVVEDSTAYASHMPQRGDIVVMHSPNAPFQVFVKRVIGLPGDIIEVDGSQHPTAVLIKPQGSGPFAVLHETYLAQKWTTLNVCCNIDGTQTVSPSPASILAGYYFVLGDNRNFSSDSRSFGFVPVSHIMAKVIGIDGSSSDVYANRPTLGP